MERKADAMPGPTWPTSLSRRSVITTGLATGFALAVRPVADAAIHTGAEGLVAGEVRIPASGGEIPAYRACPAVGGPFATILVVHEVFGVHEYIKDVCRRLAHRGYFAVAPLLFARQGNVAHAPDMKAVMAIVAAVPDAEVAADLDATVAWVATTGKADIRRLGITGFCWGGRQVWLYAAHDPRLKAAVAWYGPLGYPRNPLHPKNPPDIVAELKAPVLGLYGAEDQSIPKAQIERFAAALQAAHEPDEIVIYPGAGHGFAADYRPSYRSTAAEDGWRRMLAWFTAHGVV
jgi:carboxymethylenebutenolidase